MKLLHISDLHLGKKLREFSLIEDQKYILIKIINIIDEEKPDAILIAGDVYDKGIPPLQAVSLLDDFLTKIWKRKIPCFVISGNHDSAERLSFGSKLMEEGKIYVSKSYDGNVTPIELKDEFGPVNIYMLPFISPVEKSFTEAVEQAVQKMNVDVSKRNVLISHQLVTGAERSDSEDLSFGGAEDVAIEVFDCFDYVALGHIHKPQKCGREFVRYSGTPLKYSFSEVNHKKSVTIVELKEKNDITVRTVPLEPKRDLRVIKGSFEEITEKDIKKIRALGTKKEFYEKQNRQDFVKIILTNEDDVKDGFARLSTIYENLVFLDYDNKRTRSVSTIEDLDKIKATDPLEIFKEFYEIQNGQPMTDEQVSFSSELIKEVWRDEK